MKLHSKPEIRELLSAEIFRTAVNSQTRYATLDTPTGVMVFFYGDNDVEQTFEVNVGDDRRQTIQDIRKLMFQTQVNTVG